MERVSGKKEIKNIHEMLGSVFKELELKCNKCKDCCCSSCAYSNGFLGDYGNSRVDSYVFMLFEDEILKIAEKATDDKGFLSKKGCLLPRNIRSGTCAFHLQQYCYDYKKYPFVDEMMHNSHKYYSKLNFDACRKVIRLLLSTICAIKGEDYRKKYKKYYSY